MLFIDTPPMGGFRNGIRDGRRIWDPDVGIPSQTGFKSVRIWEEG
jgi:hypothetical protein